MSTVTQVVKVNRWMPKVKYNDKDKAKDAEVPAEYLAAPERSSTSSEEGWHDPEGDYMNLVTTRSDRDINWIAMSRSRGHADKEWISAFEAAGDGTQNPNMVAIRRLRMLIWKQTRDNSPLGGLPSPVAEKHRVPRSYAKIAKPSSKNKDWNPRTASFNITVEQNDILEKARNLLDEQPGRKVAVLSMACSHCPGGGVERGAGAQEETLWRRTDIFRFGEWHSKLYPLRPQESILYRGVRILRMPEATGYTWIMQEAGGQEGSSPSPSLVTIDVIAAAAPSGPSLTRNNQYYHNDAREDMRRRIQSILEAASHSKCTHLLLSAFGCGAFGNPPEEVAKLFREELSQCTLGGNVEVIFCIIDDHNARQRHNPNGNFVPFLHEFRPQEPRGEEVPPAVARMVAQ